MKDKLVLKRVWNKTSQQFLLLKHKVDWNGRNETPAGKAWHGRPRRRSEGGPPAESECLKWKSTSKNCNHIRGVEGLLYGYKLGISSCNPRYLSSMDINERIQQVDGGNFT
ncbi:hypothetical protein ACE8FZ_26710 [Peribacillus frigoritolerans]|uniref:hypothetical protein n=1 Tax=Peribacillus frigoritolerans TaxID=450367 RepID=UPI0035CF67B3